MISMPKLRYEMQKNKAEVLQMRGINYTDNKQSGDLTDSLNISARRFPYLSTRYARTKQAGYSNATAMTAWDHLVVVEGTNLKYNGNIVGTVTAGEKQFATVNTKLIIWPDKKYLDLKTLQVHDMGASQTCSGAVFTTSTITIDDYGVDLTTKFKAGDNITISGCTVQTSNNKDIVITAITSKVITVSADALTAATESANITFARNIPDMDFICESQNRLWGCSNNAQTIYASALGDPTNFYTYQGLSTDSYALAVGTEGSFTGCCKLSSSVLFFKETVLHKMLGSYPSEYTLYTYNVEGLKAGCHKSLQVINETLFYMGLHGVYAYAGGTPSLISSVFADKSFTAGVSGTDGDSYYLAAHEGTADKLFVYETQYGIWLLEDNLYCKDFARIGKDLYMLSSSGDIYLMTTTQALGTSMGWKAVYAPFYETSQGRKIHSKILLQLELPKGSFITISKRIDGGVWKSIKTITGKTYDAVPVRIPLERCNKFELMFEGKGPCTVLNFIREFSVGSDK